MIGTTPLFVLALVLTGTIGWSWVRLYKRLAIIRESVPTNQVKALLTQHTIVFIYVMDPLTCSTCFDLYPGLKALVARRQVPFALMSTMTDMEFAASLGWLRTPALAALKEGRLVRCLHQSGRAKLTVNDFDAFITAILKEAAA